jgi:hypothetical protein
MKETHFNNSAQMEYNIKWILKNGLGGCGLDYFGSGHRPVAGTCKQCNSEMKKAGDECQASAP